jgi:hypothetical protein
MASVSGTLTSGSVSAVFQPPRGNVPIFVSVWGFNGGAFYLTQSASASGPFAVCLTNGKPVMLTNDRYGATYDVPFTGLTSQPYFFQLACLAIASGTPNYTLAQ